MTQTYAKYGIGQLVHHKLFDYRGVIVDVDAIFQASEQWYQEVARSRPPKDRPWYHVLVHDAGHETYVAERNLEPDSCSDPINHPHIGFFFEELRDGVYLTHRATN